MMEQPNIGSQPSAGPPATGRGDRYSLWSIALIVLVFLFQIVLNDGEGLIDHAFHVKAPAASHTVSTDEFERLISIDNEVKVAYFDNWLTKSGLLDPRVVAALGASPAARHGLDLSSFHTAIEDALDGSLAALRANPDSVYFARRVILLRDLVLISPLAPVPAAGRHHGLTSPLAAYDNAAAESPDLAREIDKERDFWQEDFSSPKIPPAALNDRLAELNDFPTLLFYATIARQELCLRAGAFAESRRLTGAMQQRALFAIGALAGLISVVIVLFFAGLLILVGTFGRALRAQSTADTGTGVFDRFLYPRPERIAYADRKLRAGDLLDCFAVYLLCLTGFGTVLSVLAQFVPHVQIRRLPQIDLIYLNIGLALLSYLGASVLALLFLRWKARSLGASLSQELGLTTGPLARNVLFGAIGWGASLVLLLAVSSLSQSLFHRLPAPENPALPMLSFAPNTVCRLALYALAALAAPYFEETFFRGVLLNALLLRFRPVYACLVTGLMFGGIHPVGIVDALSLGALGTVFAWMAYLRKSLAPSMFAHFLQNSYAYLTVYLSFSLILKYG